MKLYQDEQEEKLKLIKLLMSARLFNKQEDIAETIEGGTQWAMNYFHIRKGYKTKEGEYIQNPEYTLLKVWVSNISGFYWDGHSYIETPQERAKKRFG